MRFILILLAVTAALCVNGQNQFEWDGVYALQLSDFQSSATELGNESMLSVNTGGHIGFSFYMSNAEFMFTKNFNPKVTCTFNRNAASIVAPDSASALKLVNLARYDFDLAELYARKFRKELYLNKGAFSSASFFQPIFDKIQKEYQERHIQASKEARLGFNEEKLKELHAQVITEIAELSDFCKTCKPSKRKKGK